MGTVEQRRDLVVVGAQVGHPVDQADEGLDGELGPHGGEGVERADHLHDGGVEVDLLLGLAQRGVLRGGVERGVDLAAGEGDLARVVGHRVGALGEHHVRLAVLLVHRHEHRGGAARQAFGERRRDREVGAAGAHLRRG